MSFYGSSFTFDGRSCEEFGMMLYDFNTTAQENSSFSKRKIYEDRVTRRPRSIFYGIDYEEGLEFSLIFGADEHFVSNGEDIDRSEMDVVSMWLMGPDTYRWLVIDQPDMADIRYRCIITEMEVLEYAGNKWAFKCNVHCDAPYAYHLPREYEFQVQGSADVPLFNPSSSNQIYYPKVSISISGGKSFSILNQQTGIEFRLEELPPAVTSVDIDGETGVLTSTSGLNVYKYCNFKWPSLISGENILHIEGNGIVTFVCEFPANVGG